MSKAAVTIEAFVANDLRVREAGGHRVVDVSLPHTPSKKDESGQWVDAGPTTWYQATFWDEHADAILDTIEKGSLVAVAGFPQLEVYQKNDGQPGGKILIKSPTLSLVVRKPKATTTSAPADEPWATTTPGSGDVWNSPGAYTDETPF